MLQSSNAVLTSYPYAAPYLLSEGQSVARHVHASIIVAKARARYRRSAYPYSFHNHTPSILGKSALINSPLSWMTREISGQCQGTLREYLDKLKAS